MTTRIGGSRPVSTPTSVRDTQPARATASTRSAASVDGFDGDSDKVPTPEEVENKYQSMSYDERNELYKKAQEDGWQPANKLEESVVNKIALRKSIMRSFMDMSEQQANELEKALNRMNS
jgi:hypothetical protein